MKATATVTRISEISQKDADAKAACAANIEADAAMYACDDNGVVTLPGEQPWIDPEVGP